MRKTDARVRYTQRILKESLLALLKDKPINKITVKELCQLAELNRATFYAHYSDCFALLDSIEEELLEAFGRSLSDYHSMETRALIQAIYDIIDQYAEACRVLIFEGTRPSVVRRMIDLARDSIIIAWRQQLPRASEAELDMLYTHLSNGMMHVVLEGYHRHGPEAVARFVEQMVSVSLVPFQ